MKCNWIFLNTSWGLEPKEKHVLIVERKRGKSVEVILGCEVLQELFWLVPLILTNALLFWYKYCYLFVITTV